MRITEATIRAQGMLESGELADANAANVAIVQMMGVRIISGRIDSAIRKALNAAVKSGESGHLPKKGLLPEAYFHKNGKANALEMRQRIAVESIKSIEKACI